MPEYNHWLHLLLRTVDPDETETNFLGQLKKDAYMSASPFKGCGMAPEDYEQMERLQLLRKSEVAELQVRG